MEKHRDTISYIGSFPKEVQVILKLLRATIKFKIAQTKIHDLIVYFCLD